MKLAIIGTGYVGLITGACFAEFGYQTVCIDKDENRVSELNNSKCPFYEPGIDSLLDKHFLSLIFVITINLIFVICSELAVVAVDTAAIANNAITSVTM